MRHVIACVVAVAVGAAAAVVVSARRAPALPPGWAEVVVLGRDDAPIEGVTLRWDEHWPPFADTDARGVARIDLAGHGDAPSVFLGGTLTLGDFDQSSQSFGQKVRSPRTVLRLPNAIPFDVTFFDARDGRPLQGGRAGWRKRTLIAARDPSDATIRGLVNNGCSWPLESEAPSGFVLPAEERTVRPITSAFVHRQRMTIPVWPAGRVRVRVREADGRPAAGPLQFSWYPNEQDAWTTVFADADGRFESRSLPLMPNAVVPLFVRRADHTARGELRIADGSSEYDVELSLPECSDGGGCGTVDAGRHFGQPPVGGDATLRLRVLRSDGTPARRVRVLLRAVDSSVDPESELVIPHEDAGPMWQTMVATDDDGRVSRTDLAMSRERRQDAVRVILAEPGCTYTTVDVPLPPGGTADCVLRESTGEEIALAVVDREGRPVPWARISAETQDERNWTWFPVENGVQNVSPRTGLDGRITLRGLPRGLIRVEAASCGRSALETLVVGKPATLRLRD